MKASPLAIECSELRQITEDYPAEMEVIVAMLIEADEELCSNLAG